MNATSRRRQAPKKLAVFMIGGTGLLGSAGAAELLDRGHRVRSLALPPVPTGDGIPGGMDLHLGDHRNMSDDELLALMDGHDAFVFAAGLDERVMVPAPAHQLFHEHNVAPLLRLLPLAKRAGLSRAVVLGSYLTTMARRYPEQDLGGHHPYIRSRLEQDLAAMAADDADFAVSTLELPYIFGTQEGRKPVWVFLVETLKKMPGAAFYPRGGTAVVTVNQVAQAICGAVEQGEHRRRYEVGWFNLTWTELLGYFHRSMGMPNRRVVTIPDALFTASTVAIALNDRRRGVERGLDVVKFVPLMTDLAYLDRDDSLLLGVTDDDLGEAIDQSVRLCLDALDGRPLVDMPFDRAAD